MALPLGVKLTLDAALTALTGAALGFHLTGNRLHEWLGVTLVTLLIVHQLVNRGWYRTLVKVSWQRLSAAARFSRLINLLLIADLLVLGISGVMLSRQVFHFLDLPHFGWVNRLHMAGSSWFVILAGAHLGLHRRLILNKLCPSALRTSHLAARFGRVLCTVLTLWGLYQFAVRQTWRMALGLLEYPVFDFYESWGYFLCCTLSTLTAFACLAALLENLLSRLASRRTARRQTTRR